MTQQILHYIIKDSKELNDAYINFVPNNGLFVPTEKSFSLGDIISVDILLPNEIENLRVEGKILWITSKHAVDHIPGVGIQFTEPYAYSIQQKIEQYLDPTLPIGKYTM